MKKWLCIIVLVGFAACQKGVEPFTDSETGSGGAGTSASIVGTWKFDSFSVNDQNTLTTVQSDTIYKTITNVNFATTNNSGTFTFKNDSTFSANNIAYDLSYITNSYNYANDVLIDSNKIPASYPLDSLNTTNKYELIGNDSIYFPQGYVISFGTTLATAIGGKFKINGNILSIMLTVNKDTSNNSGIPYNLIDEGTFTTILKKQ